MLLFSLAVFALAMPNELFIYGSPAFGLFSILPLLFFVESIAVDPPIRGKRRVGIWGGMWGIGFTLTQYFWLSQFGEFSLWTLGGVALVYFGYGALFFNILAYTISRKPFTVSLIVPVVFVVFEYTRSIGYLAFPWNLLAHPFHGVLPFIQAAGITGTFFLGFLIAYFQTLVFLFLRKRLLDSNMLCFFCVLVVLVFAFGFARLADEDSPDQYLDVVLVQQNEDSWARQSSASALENLQNLSLSADLASPADLASGRFDARFDPNLYIWSETSLATVPEAMIRSAVRDPETSPFLRFLRTIDAPVLTGAPLLADPANPRAGLMNGAVVFALESSGTISADRRYAKQRLIPFAEHVPVQGIPFLADFLENQIGISAMGWQTGTHHEPLPVETAFGILHAGIPICFEDSMSQQTRLMSLSGADLFINLTNNSWSGTNSAQAQHLAAARFRTVETGRLLIRSTNSGISSVIDSHGRLLYSAPVFQAYAASVRVPITVPDNQTPYTILGDWFAAAVSYLLYLFILLRPSAQGLHLPAEFGRRRRRW